MKLKVPTFEVGGWKVGSWRRRNCPIRRYGSADFPLWDLYLWRFFHSFFWIWIFRSFDLCWAVWLPWIDLWIHLSFPHSFPPCYSCASGRHSRILQAAKFIVNLIDVNRINRNLCYLRRRFVLYIRFCLLFRWLWYLLTYICVHMSMHKCRQATIGRP